MGSTVEAIFNKNLLRSFASVTLHGNKSLSISGDLIINNNNKSELTQSINNGQRILSLAYENINSSISVLNLTEQRLGELKKIAEKLYSLSDTATASDLTVGERQNLEQSFEELVNQFNQKNNEDISSINYLTEDGINQILNIVGLSKEDSKEISNIFNAFITDNQGNLASFETFDNSPVYIPSTAYSANGNSYNKGSYTEVSLDDKSLTLERRSDAYVAKERTKDLINTINNNLETIESLRGVIKDNLNMVKAASDFLNNIPSNQYDNITDISKLISDLQKNIKKDTSISQRQQVDNLDNIAQATIDILQES